MNNWYHTFTCGASSLVNIQPSGAQGGAAITFKCSWHKAEITVTPADLPADFKSRCYLNDDIDVLYTYLLLSKWHGCPFCEREKRSVDIAVYYRSERDSNLNYILERHLPDDVIDIILSYRTLESFELLLLEHTAHQVIFTNFIDPRSKVSLAELVLFSGGIKSDEYSESVYGMLQRNIVFGNALNVVTILSQSSRYVSPLRISRYIRAKYAERDDKRLAEFKESITAAGGDYTAAKADLERKQGIAVNTAVFTLYRTALEKQPDNSTLSSTLTDPYWQRHAHNPVEMIKLICFARKNCADQSVIVNLNCVIKSYANSNLSKMRGECPYCPFSMYEHTQLTIPVKKL